MEANRELNAFLADMFFSPEDLDSHKIRDGYREEGDYDGFAILKRHAADLKEVAEESE